MRFDVFNLYIDDNLLIENNIGALSTVKIWFANYFDMKIKDQAFARLLK